jgi:hypothetical protein
MRFLCLLALHCAPLSTATAPAVTPPCSGGSSPDAPRAATLKRILSRDKESAALAAATSIEICFLSGGGLGVEGGGVAFLPAGESDLALAARLAHLLIHRRDNLGDGCGRGPVVAYESENQARRLESRLRARFGLAALPLSEDAERDYRARCP